MADVNYKYIFGKKAADRKRILAVCPSAKAKSGIYILTRLEEGIKYAYIGQAVNVLDRLASHLEGYDQWIDLSIKKHKLWSQNNPTGWKIGCLYFPESELNDRERYYIHLYANKGYQLRNKTIGGQDSGKAGMDANKAPKGYRDGVKQGRINLARELKHIADLHLNIELNAQKVGNAVSQRQLEKFLSLLENPNGDDNEN